MIVRRKGPEARHVAYSGFAPSALSFLLLRACPSSFPSFSLVRKITEPVNNAACRLSRFRASAIPFECTTRAVVKKKSTKPNQSPRITLGSLCRSIFCFILAQALARAQLRAISLREFTRYFFFSFLFYFQERACNIWFFCSLLHLCVYTWNERKTVDSMRLVNKVGKKNVFIYISNVAWWMAFENPIDSCFSVKQVAWWIFKIILS